MRTGYADQHTQADGFRAGLGLRIRNLSFDFAYAGFGELGNVYRYELSFRFGAPHPRLSPQEHNMLQQAQRAMRVGNYEHAALLANGLIELEPDYKKARQLFKMAMEGLDYQKRQATAQRFNPYAPSSKAPTNEQDDLEELLNIETSKAAQVDTPEFVPPHRAETLIKGMQ